MNEPVPSPPGLFFVLMVRLPPGATLVVAPVFCLKPVWRSLLDEFTSGLQTIVIEQLSDLKAVSVDDLRKADVVVVVLPSG